MRVLALEPYYSGSHRAFLDGWQENSRHEFTVLGLAAHSWKWRMRHSAVTLAEQVGALVSEGQTWDVLFCSAMLNLAEFKGLVPASVRDLPSTVYFHENQLTYPVRHSDERDLHFAYTNFTTSLAADRVWFNSAFHRDEFLGALREFLARMPDHKHTSAVEQILRKASVYPQGIQPTEPRPPRQPGPTHLIWAARWEHDKNPVLFFDALKDLLDRRVEFWVSVIGEQFEDVPPVFDEARQWLRSRVVRWGYQESRDAYLKALQAADIFVSTADHEFFGIAAVEAMQAGAYPLLPRRLAYPEILSAERLKQPERFFYDGTRHHLVTRLRELILRTDDGTMWARGADELQPIVEPYLWSSLAPVLDDALESTVEVVR